MKKIVSFVMIFLLLIGLTYAQTSGGGGGGSSAVPSPTGGGGSGGSSSGGSCQEYYTCPDGSKVEYCEIVENYDDSGNLLGAGCKCKVSPQSQCPITTTASGGSGGGRGGISPISGGLKYKYEFFGKIGGDEKGTSNYEFNYPNDVAIDSLGNIYVVDTNNNRIMIYNSNLDFIDELDANFNEPMFIHIDDRDNVYVVDQGKESRGRVRKFDKHENEILALSQPDVPEDFAEEHGLVGLIGFNPNGLAVNSEGKIFLSEERIGNDDFNRIHIYNSDGTFDEHFKDYRFDRPRHIAFDDDNYLYISDYMNNQILIYDDDLDYVSKIGNQGFHQPADIDFDSEGLFYVVDKFNQRVEVFDTDLNYFATIAGNGAGNDNNQLYFPSGISIGDGDKVYITNHKNHRISIFLKKQEDLDETPQQPITTEPEFICDGCVVNEKCFFRGTRLNIDLEASYCNVNNEWGIQKKDGIDCQNNYECKSNICEKNQCGRYCEGCLDENNNCIPFGTRLENKKYCDIDKSIKKQKSEEVTCNNNYECTSNVCVNSKCIEPGFIQKILNWFKRLFGG